MFFHMCIEHLLCIEHPITNEAFGDGDSFLHLGGRQPLTCFRHFPHPFNILCYYRNINMMDGKIIMWGVKFNLMEGNQLPLVTGEVIAGLATIIVGIRVVVHLVMEKGLNIGRRKEDEELRSLDHSYFYHLSIIILLLTDVNWNVFDLCIWVFSYIGMGMIRRAIYFINVEKNTMLSDYSYNPKLMPLLHSSKLYGFFILCFSLFCLLAINFLFLGLETRLLSLLCFPLVMLALDAFFLFASSLAVSNNLLCFYNPNINQISPTYHHQMCHHIATSSVKIWHIYSLFALFLRSVLYRQELFDCMWVLSIFNAFYKASYTLVTSVSKYRSFRKLTTHVNAIFLPSPSAKDHNCVICMEPLLNCHQLVSCGHKIHYKCFFQWVQVKYECPVCRARIELHV